MSIDRPDLAGAFSSRKAPVDRAAGLTRLLPPPRPRPSTSPSTSTSAPDDQQPALATAPVVEPAEPVTPPHASSPRTSSSRRSVRAIESVHEPVSATADITTNIAVYLEPDLLSRVKSHRRSNQTTYDQLAVDAFAAIPDQALQHAFTPTTPVQPAAAMPARQRRPRGTAGIQIQLRLTAPQLSWLSAKQQALGAPSRSALVAAVLRLYLTD